MYILGISAYYHDSAACLIKDGQIVFAVEEERFTRIKHDNQFPIQSIYQCLKYGSININKIDYIAYYEKPLLKFERIIDTFIKTWPFSLESFVKGIPEWVNYKIKIESIIRKKLAYKGKIYFVPHHLSHAAISYYSSPFDNAGIVTVDGVGEYQTTALWNGTGNRITLLKSINFPHSLGLFYSTFTAFLGFKVNEDEYKLMGLAAYGKPTYKKQIYELIKVKEDGSFCLDLNYFNFQKGKKMWNERLEKLFGLPRRTDDKISNKHKNLAASVQSVTEDIYLKIINHMHSLTPNVRNLCLGGGVALNALANGKIYKQTPYKKIYIFGAAGDSGGAIGSALYVYHSIKNHKKKHYFRNLYFGTEYPDVDIKRSLDNKKLKYQSFSNRKNLIDAVASLLSLNKIVGWFENKMEFGPRALGSRSILANPRYRFMKTKVNKIKKREQFRPFAGSVLQDRVQVLFSTPYKNQWFPFMNFCFQVKPEAEDKIKAIVHKDKTCRIQTVNKDNDLYFQLIKKFYEITGTPCILNTSFNLKGEPIVETPDQAIEDFLKTKMDYLAIGSFLVGKN
jgi:carbamoyltransferase